MKRFTSFTALRKRQEELQDNVQVNQRVIALCGVSGCGGGNATTLVEAFEKEIRKMRASGKVIVKTTGCHGFCEQGPLLVVYPEKTFYPRVTSEKVPAILAAALRGETADDLLLKDPDTGKSLPTLDDIPFYSRQLRRVLRMHSFLDPTSLDDAILHDGWSALAMALEGLTPGEVTEKVEKSGLRGRGGGGFPTGRKWKMASEFEGDEKYIVCNADEGDPGAFMDRSLLEGTPHAVLEGMAIAGYAIGASKGIIYVRSEYPMAVHHVEKAVKDATRANLLGNNILGSGFAFTVDVRIGAGAFVCGEETALIASLEGERGWPRPRPPYPVEKGFNGNPTCINNVETLANVPVIILNDAWRFASVGTLKSKGTKVFALAGKVNNTGLIEVPMGTTLREAIFEIGGGIQGGRKFKAAQLGGPSGGCLPAKYLDLPIDYDSLQSAGAIMGSGGMIVMDQNTCMVDVARFFMEFVTGESCGQCTPCREGTAQMLRILRRICEGKGREGDIEELEQLGTMIKSLSLCGLGQTAPNPVLSTIRYFRHEYEAHIRHQHCEANSCGALQTSSCQNACPVGVNVPEYIGLIAEGKTDDAVDVMLRRNPFVSVCGRVCDHPCQSACRRGELDSPVAIRALKRFASEESSKERWSQPLMPVPTGKPEVAIIGAGPAGLSCAYFLALMGRSAVVFEKQPIPGGMLAIGIPEYRLSKDTLGRDIDFIRAHGVEIRTGQNVRSADALLKKGFRAVFVATGAQQGRRMGIPGERLAGNIDALDLLRDHALGRVPRLAGDVVVIGGGNSAVDAARTANRIGAKSVTILYRRTRQEMPAYDEEILEAEREGVKIVDFVAPVAVVGKAKRVVGIRMIKMRQGATDDQGRRRPVPIEGSTYVHACDVVIRAVGQVASLEAVSKKLIDGKWLNVEPETMATSNKKIFAGGDCLTGGGTVIGSVADGQKAAIGIDRALGGRGMLLPDVRVSLARPSAESIEENAKAFHEPLLALARRRNNFLEVVGGISATKAQCEARRCLRCDME